MARFWIRQQIHSNQKTQTKEKQKQHKKEKQRKKGKRGKQRKRKKIKQMKKAKKIGRKRGNCHSTRPNELNTRAVDDTHISRSVCVIRFCNSSLRVQNKCVYGKSVCVHSQHGSGAVIVASRTTGTVNLVVSRKSGGAVRAPENAGDKTLCRSAAAVAARIERGYLKRIRTAGSTACVNNHVDFRGTGTDGGSHPAAERTSTTARDGGDDTRTRKRRTRTAIAEHDRHTKTARAGRSGRHTGDWQARPVRRRSDVERGLVVQTEIVPRSRGPSVPARVDDDRDIVDTETQRKPRERGKCIQHTDVLHFW